MDNPDILTVILNNIKLSDSFKYICINKLFCEIIKLTISDNINKLYYFKRFKKRTVFPRKKPTRGSYYTFKNKYINKEESPILFF